MTGQIDIAGDDVTLRALTWGDWESTDSPVAVCLHGFPDTAHGWRKVAPQLADAGWRVVAPFMRGYAPSSLSTADSYHVGALMDDALRVLDAAGPTGRDVIIGHDWGALAATGLAAMPGSPFQKAAILSVPPPAAFRSPGGLSDAGRLAVQLPRQLRRSWYIMFFQLPWLPERAAERVVPKLWRDWSPGYDGTEDVRHVLDAIGTQEHWRSALGYYRATVRNSSPPARYAELHQHWLNAPLMPTLYLHGTDDGCASADYTEWVRRVLPEGSAAFTVDGGGHFLQLDQPAATAARILDFIGSGR